jgi:NADH-quinone oxidoreductase subunit N
LLAYSFMNIGAFGMVIFLTARGEECNEITDLAGLSQKLPGLALPMAIFMFTLAGLPPSAGFFGKFYLFKAAVAEGMVGLAVFAVIMSAVSLYYYLRVITIMYLHKLPDGATPTADSCPYLATAALVSVAGVLLMGIFPSYVMGLLKTVF